MQIDTAKLKISTKALVSAAATIGVFLQIPAVNQAFTKVANAHPRLAPAIGAIGAIWTLLHDPKVAEFLGIKKTLEVKETTEEVGLADSAEDAK